MCLLTAAGVECTDDPEPAEAGQAGLISAAAPGGLLRIGNYEILEELGHGGMGVVFKARQRGLDRVVALKMILGGQFSGADAVARFRAEAALAAQLQHPGIVPVHEVGEHDGQPFFSMDYIEGRSLAELAREHPLPARAAATYLEAIAEAVHYAHERGVIHRDLKPSNILIDSSDHPRITDFGLAKRLSEDVALTQSGQVLGSPSYAAPEQVMGWHARIGPASDIYSLGALLYHLLTRRPPFVAETLAAAVDLVREAEPVPVRRLNPSVPVDLETICLKCLEKKPDRRYATAAALADDLKHFLNGEPVGARPVGASGRLARWCRRKPLIAGLGVGVSVLTLAILIGSPVAIYRIQHARNEAEREAYYAQIGLAKTYADQGNMDQAMSVLTNCPARYRHWEWGYLAYLCHKDIASFQSTPGSNVAQLAFSPKGGLLLSLSQDGLMQLWDWQTHREVFRLGTPTNPVGSAAFDPRGERLAAGFGTGLVRVWTLRTGDPQARAAPAFVLEPALDLEAHGEAVTHVRWHREGTRLLTAGRGGLVRLWDAATGRFLRDWAGPSPPLAGLDFSTAEDRVFAWNHRQFVAWDCSTGREIQRAALEAREDVLLWPSPDASRFAISGARGRLALGHTPATARELIVARLEMTEVRQRAFFSPDGQWLCNVGDESTARVWRVSDGREHFAIPVRVWLARFSPDGRLLATSGRDTQVVIWDLIKGRELLRLHGHRALIRELQFGPDSHWVATRDQGGTVKLWSAETGREFLFEEDSVWAASYSPDGRRIASAGQYGGLTVWNADTGEALARLRGPLEWISGVAFSPDGKRMVTAGSHRLVRVWDAATWQNLGRWADHERWIGQPMFSQDGRWLFTFSLDGALKVWDVASNRLHRSLATGMTPLVAAAMSSDGQWVAAGGPDGAVRLWEAMTGRELAPLRGHSNTIFAVAFSPDSARLLTSGLDGDTRLWDRRTGRLLTSWTARGCDWPVAFSADGQRLFAGTTRHDNAGHDAPKLVVRDGWTGRELLSLDASGMCARVEYQGNRRRLLTGTFEGVLRQFEAWPWREADYPGEPSAGLTQRLRRFADHYWSERLTVEDARWRRAGSPTNEVLVLYAWEPWLFPSRDPRATPRQVNLDGFYSAPLTLAAFPAAAPYGSDNDFRNLPRGMVEFHGISFDVRGIIQLGRFDARGWLIPTPVG